MSVDQHSIWYLLWQMIRYDQSLYWIDTCLWLLLAGLPALPGLVIRKFFNTLTKSIGFRTETAIWQRNSSFRQCGTG